MKPAERIRAWIRPHAVSAAFYLFALAGAPPLARALRAGLAAAEPLWGPGILLLAVLFLEPLGLRWKMRFLRRRNADDGLTPFAVGNISRVTSLTTTLALTNLSAGRGTIDLGTPNGRGTVDVYVNLDSAGAPSNCGGHAEGTTVARSYLSGKWCGTAHDRDPVARATFGIQAGRKGPIYIRENY